MHRFSSPVLFPKAAVWRHPSPAFQLTATHLFLIPSAWRWKLREHYGSRQWSDSEWASAGSASVAPSAWDTGEAETKGIGGGGLK